MAQKKDDNYNTEGKKFSREYTNKMLSLQAQEQARQYRVMNQAKKASRKLSVVGLIIIALSVIALLYSGATILVGYLGKSEILVSDSIEMPTEGVGVPPPTMDTITATSDPENLDSIINVLAKDLALMDIYLKLDSLQIEHKNLTDLISPNTNHIVSVAELKVKVVALDKRIDDAYLEIGKNFTLAVSIISGIVLLVLGLGVKYIISSIMKELSSSKNNESLVDEN